MSTVLTESTNILPDGLLYIDGSLRAAEAGTRVRLQDLGSDHIFKAVCTSSEVELLKLRQLTVERTAEFKIHKYRQQDQRDYG